MTKLITKWFLAALAILFAAYAIPGISIASFYTALVVAALLGIINMFFRPILVVLTLPINIATLGFFTFIINGLLFWVLATVVKGFYVDSFFAAFFGSLTVSVIRYLGERIFLVDD